MESVRYPGQGMNTSKMGLMALFMVWILILAGGCAPKRVTRQAVSRDSSPPVETPAKSVPDLPPVIEEDTPDPTGSSAELPAPRVRVASGPYRQGAETPKPPGVPNGALGDRAAGLARDQLGKQYQWGASGPDKFDCSGLVQYSYSAAGLKVPRTSRDQYGSATPISLTDAEPGDLLFFRYDRKISHVAIYLGDERFVHAPSSGKTVSVASLRDPHYQQHFVRAGRL